MQKVIALEHLAHCRAPGDTFEAPDDQARLLVMLGKARYVTTEVADDAHVHTSRAILDALETAPGRRRTPTYRRRDLIAESSED